MNKVIWVFGCSASGKETFIKNILKKEAFGIEHVLKIDTNRAYIVKPSIQLISKCSKDNINYQRNLIIDEIIKLNNKFDDSFFLIKGQNFDIRNNIVEKLTNKLPDIEYEIVFLNANVKVLIDRVKRKDWFDETRGFREYIESIDRTLGYMKNLNNYKITYIDSTNEYKVIEKPKLLSEMGEEGIMKHYEINKNEVKFIINTNVGNLDTNLNLLLNNYFEVYESSNNDVDIYKVLIDFILDKDLYQSSLDLPDILKITNSGNIVLSSGKNKIKIIISKFDENALIDLKRIVIDCFARYYDFKKVYFVHGASVVNKQNGMATVFVGASGSGKTTNMLQFLNTNSYNYMANDRIGFYVQDSQVYVIGFPSNVGIRASTLEIYPEIKRRLVKYFSDTEYAANIIESLINNCTNKLSIKINNLKQAFQCDSIFCAPLGTLIFTEFDKNSNKVEVEKITLDEVIERMEKYKIHAVSKEQIYLNDVISFDVDKYELNFICLSNYDSYLYKQNGTPIGKVKVLEKNEKKH